MPGSDWVIECSEARLPITRCWHRSSQTKKLRGEKMALPNVLSIAGDLRGINPATGELMRVLEMDCEAAIDAKLSLARLPFSAGEGRLSPSVAG